MLEPVGMGISLKFPPFCVNVCNELCWISSAAHAAGVLCDDSVQRGIYGELHIGEP